MASSHFYKYKLMECAKAIQGGNLDLAESLLKEIRTLISSPGPETDNATRKVVKYYAEALVRRVYGIHPEYPLPLVPSTYLYDFYDFVFYPFDWFADVTTKYAIINAFDGNKRLHVIDFSIMVDPWRWYYLMEDLVDQPGGLPSFQLTSIVPKLSKNLEFLREIRSGLTELARELPVNFKLRQLVANTADDIVKCVSEIRRTSSDDEMLVVRWAFSLHTLLSQEGAIQQVLSKLNDLKPDIMVIVEQEGNHNSPDFLNRLDQSFEYYSTAFDSLERDSFRLQTPVLEYWERHFRRQIGNLVACEGATRIERHESLGQWQQRMSQAGFRPIHQSSDELREDWEGTNLSEYRIAMKDEHALLCRNNCQLVVAMVWKLSGDPTPSFINGSVVWNSCLVAGLRAMENENLNTLIIEESKVLTGGDKANDPSMMRGVDMWPTRGFSMNQMAASAKLFDILESVCHEHMLPMALTWISCGEWDDTNSKGNQILCIEETACYANATYIKGFMEACVHKHCLEGGQGVAGKAIRSDVYFVADISTLDVVDYPFVKEACQFELKAAVAIRLTSTYANNVDYIVEFFLPLDMKESLELLLLVKRLAHILKEKCKDLWIVWDGNLNGANEGFKIMFKDVRMPKMPPAAVSRSSLPALSDSVSKVNEIMALSTFKSARDRVRTHDQPLEQEVREKNAEVKLALNGDNVMVGKEATNLQAKRRKVSIVWEGFHKHEGEHGEVWAMCQYCKKQYRAESTRGTSNLRRHLQKCLASRRRDELSSSLVEKGELRSKPIQTNFVFDQERSRLDIARMTIKHGYPLDMVQHRLFDIFVKNLQPVFELYSKDIVEADVLLVCRQEKERLIKCFDNLPCRVCLEIELQSSDEKKMSYCCLTLHYIDDGWELKKKILAFKNLQCNYDMRTLHEVIKNVLTGWSVCKNVHCILLNAPPPNDRIIGELKSKLSDQVSHIHGDSFYVSCYGQILVLLVQEGFCEIKHVLYKIRGSVEYAHGTQLGRQKFQAAINEVKLQDKNMASHDVPTRWDTTFLMLENALGLRKAFTHLKKVDGDFIANLSAEEWNMAEVVYKCLKVFQTSISNLSTSIEDFFLNVCDVYRNLLEWGKSQHTYVRSMADRMKVKFDKYWNECSLVLGISVVLNPCFKFDLVEYGYQQIYGSDAFSDHLSIFRGNLNRIYDKYANDISNPTSTSDPAIADVNCCSTSNDLDFDHKVWLFDKWRKRKYGSNSVGSQRVELDQYLEQPPAHLDEGCNVLAWWHANAQHFPTLGKMARDFFPVVSAILSKSHVAEDVMKNPAFDDVRPDILEALMCGKDWLECPKRRIDQPG